MYHGDKINVCELKIILGAFLPAQIRSISYEIVLYLLKSKGEGILIFEIFRIANKITLDLEDQRANNKVSIS